MQSLESLKAKVNSKKQSQEEIDRQLAQLEQAKKELEMNDIWEQAYARIERQIKSQEETYEREVRKAEQQITLYTDFFKEMGSDKFELNFSDDKIESVAKIYRMKDEYVTPDTRAYDLLKINEHFYRDEEREQYNHIETINIGSTTVKRPEIKFIPYHIVEPVGDVERIADDKLVSRDVTVSRNYEGKWSINGLGYELGKRNYKTGNRIESRVLKYFRASVRERYQSLLKKKVIADKVAELEAEGYEVIVDDRYSRGHSWSDLKVELPNGITAKFSKSINYNTGEATWSVTNVEMPKPEWDSKTPANDVLGKLANIELQF